MAGLRRDQIVMLDLAACPVAVTGWSTTRYQQQCAAVFATYLRDVDVSPDGSYFVVMTTGGDTLSSVAVTGTAVYVGSHQRWMNNSLADDRARARSPARASPPSTGQRPALSSGRLIYATTTGTLSTVDFRPASPPAPPRW